MKADAPNGTHSHRPKTGDARQAATWMRWWREQMLIVNIISSQHFHLFHLHSQKTEAATSSTWWNRAAAHPNSCTHPFWCQILKTQLPRNRIRGKTITCSCAQKTVMKSRICTDPLQLTIYSRRRPNSLQFYTCEQCIVWDSLRASISSNKQKN